MLSTIFLVNIFIVKFILDFNRYILLKRKHYIFLRFSALYHTKLLIQLTIISLYPNHN